MRGRATYAARRSGLRAPVQASRAPYAQANEPRLRPRQVAVDLGLKLPGAKYAALTSYTAHQGTADYELFFLLLLVGTAETIGFKQIYDMMDGADRDAGDFGFDPLMLLKGNEVQYKEAELVHGRAAMLAFSAVVTQGAMNDAFGVGSQTFPYF